MTKKWIALSSALLMAAIPSWAQQLPPARAPEFVWKQSLPVRPGDARITSIGGTEVRALAVFDKKLFAAIGYWMDTEKANPALPGAQVLRLDGAGSAWQVDLELDERNPRGLRLYQAISTLEKVRFTTDSASRQLAEPVDLLLAAAWKRGRGLDVFSRVIGSDARLWSKTTIPGQEDAPRGTQIRVFSLHRDQITGGDIVFAGATNAIFTGRYDRERQDIDWNPQPEWEGNFGGNLGEAKGRVSSFADCNGKLYAAAYNTIYERLDGNSPAWKKVFETTINSQSEHTTGFRGLTCVRGPSGSDEVLLVSVEDYPSRIYRIDLSRGYNATLELEVSSFLTNALGTKTTYAIVAYNDMTQYPYPAGSCARLLLGLEANTPEASQTFDRHNPNAYYLVRDCSGRYVLHEIRDSRIEPKPELVSVRTLAVSPFQSDSPGTVYAGGFDANRNPVHNTAWLYKGVPAAGAN